MCGNCFILTELFKTADSNPHQNYFPILALLKEMNKQSRIDLFAGDCPLEEVERHLSEEKHYTIQHYFKCVDCNQYFLIGACIRGMPIYKCLDDLKDLKVKSTLWGSCGSIFEE
ncbi:hypothetical protein [Pontibacillus marinus]|uniref:Uncharacterized protein n=1 Tax=Pontibacillus marinus BH030004 = DSM 16465 TaxID=1385511 RepID=A0A0A5FTR0_9BACI|nr:hypothetical protein [Pontibacillus marinus]KGX84156.1 hypothetical protein N783_18845 [Pontibacillus marinus BH030004 = DSM 16465]